MSSIPLELIWGKQHIVVTTELVSHQSERLHDGPVPPDAEESQHHCRAPGHPHQTVHQHRPAPRQGRVDELCHRLEMSPDVCRRQVGQPQPKEGDPQAPIVVFMDVHEAGGRTFSSVEDVGDPPVSQEGRAGRGGSVPDIEAGEHLVRINSGEEAAVRGGALNGLARPVTREIAKLCAGK